MRESGRTRSLSNVLARASALVVVPVLALGAATAFSPDAGAASTPGGTGSATLSYSGGMMMAADPTGGYWTVTPAGAVTPHGEAPALGSPALSNMQLTRPIVGMAGTHDGKGYWLVASDGGIFSYGDATFFGSTGAIHLNKPIVGMAATTDGKGYWLVASDGGIFSYGDATFFGSTGAIHLNKPIVGMAATSDGSGYWLVASDGGIFNYGDASFYGSTGAIRLNLPIVGMAPTTDGNGYWLVAFDGGVFTFGDAGYFGSTAGRGMFAYGLVVDPSSPGYSVVTSDGNATGCRPSTPTANVQPTTRPAAGRSRGTRHHDDHHPAAPDDHDDRGRPAPRPPRPGPRDHHDHDDPGPRDHHHDDPGPRAPRPRPRHPGTTTTTGPATASGVSSPGLLQGAYVSSAQPVRHGGLRTTDRDLADRRHRVPAGQQRVGGHGRIGGSLNWLTSAWRAPATRSPWACPIIPTNSSGTAGRDTGPGATGAYNPYYVTLAQTLVNGGQANAYLRLGWEFDGSWMAWAATTPNAEAEFALYFQQIVTAMRSVAGEHFRFEWNPDAGAFTQSGYSVAAAYPGNAYVDVIGLDAYDQSWATPQTSANAWTRRPSRP